MPAQPNAVGPPPTTKPPTPPQLGRGTVQLKAGSTGTLGKANREYRTPPAVVPPQVPSHYAPNYPVGHPRRQTSERGPGYSAVPMPPSQQIAPVNIVFVFTIFDEITHYDDLHFMWKKNNSIFVCRLI